MAEKYRHLIQLLSTVLCNGYLIGFKEGKIFQGSSKQFCVPVLNCYSCPGALGACPIGSLQAVLGDRKHSVSFYVLGLLMLFGIVLGRLVCGFLCPFGFLQDLLDKIPLPKLTIPTGVDQKLRYVKYAVLLLFVIVAPLVFTNAFGIGSPYFCKLICPAGTLEGGLPLVLTTPALKKTIGALFYWKLSILILVVLASGVIYRPFCKYLCPLGAFYGIFSRFSLYQITVDPDACISCGTCERVCKMQVNPTVKKGMGECIRCGACKAVCPKQAIHTEFCGKSINPIKKYK